MKTFILKMELRSGLHTELQSDTIYGHFCWRLKERLGINSLKNFIAQYNTGEPVFLLSDGLLKSETGIHFPQPFVFNKPVIQGGKNDKILEFVKRKKQKENEHISINMLNDFLSNGTLQINSEESSIEKLREEKSGPLIEEQLRVSVSIDRNSFAAEAGKVFSYSPKFVREGISYVILLKILDEKMFEQFHCEQVIKDVFSLGYGKKKSAGFGQFDEKMKFEPFNEIEEPTDGGAFIVLGNYLPSAEDAITPIGYDINIKYGKFGEELSQSSNPFKNPIVFLKAGSCFKTKDNEKQFYGRVTDHGEISGVYKDHVQFGCPFFLRVKNT